MKTPLPVTARLDLGALAKGLFTVPPVFAGKLVVSPAAEKLSRYVEPVLFSGYGAALDWNRYAATGAQKQALANALRGLAITEDTAHLRWMTHQLLGVPDAPFQVWRRMTSPLEGKALHEPEMAFAVGGVITFQFKRPLAKLFLVVTVGANGAAFSALRGAPLLEGAEFPVVVKPGTQSVTISSPAMTGISITGVEQVHGATGITIEDYAALDGWRLIETAGPPVAPGKYPTPPGWTGGQGPGPAPLLAPFDAAVDRIRRGGPPFGWPDRIDAATPAPAWEAPDPELLVKSLDGAKGALIPRLHDMLTLPFFQQAGHRTEVAFDHTTAGGVELPPGSAKAPTLGVLQLAAATDPFLALALGYGTAAVPLSREERELLQRGTIVTGAARFPLALDYLVTARFGGEEGFELAAPIPAPPPALVPFAPTNLLATPTPPARPAETDGPWSVGVALDWDRVPRNSLYTVASAAAARAGEPGCQPILEPRAAGGFRPIAATPGVGVDGTTATRFGLRDPGVELSADAATMRWGVTQQTGFGLWSAWSAAGATLAAPPPQAPVVAAVRLDPAPAAPGADPCLVALEVEIIHDWTVRAPESITLVGDFYTAATRNAPPPSLKLPLGLERGTGAGSSPLVISFAGDVASTPDAKVTPLDPDSGMPLDGAPGPVRRYLVRVENLPVHFGLGFAGVVVWASATERAAPKRPSAPSAPKHASVADPRPPVPKPDPVPRFGSLPDAQGRSHVGLGWQPGAPGTRFEVFECDEISLLAAANLPEPAMTASLVERLTVLEKLDYAARRTSFARRDGPPIAGTAVDIALPRGSTTFHAFVIQGVSAGGVESAWPATVAGVFLVYPGSAPQPEAPWLTPVPRKAGGICLTLEPRAGVPAATLELYRTRVPDAARDLSLMGPPVAVVPADGLAPVELVDLPPPSWRPWWYRAAARSATDETVARYGTLGRASPAVSMFVPPAGPPAIEHAMLLDEGDGILSLTFTCAVPRTATPKGVHRIAIDLGALAGSLDAAVDALPAALIRVGDDWRYRFPRPAPTFPIIVRATDPLGRVGEAHLAALAKPKPVPVLLAPAARTLDAVTTSTFLVPAGALAPPASPKLPPQKLVLERPAMGTQPVQLTLKLLADGKPRKLGGGLIARADAADAAGLHRVTVTMPAVTGTLRLTLTAAAGTVVREVTPRW